MMSEICVSVMVLIAIAGVAARAYHRYARPGTVSDDIRADARRALNDTRRLLR